MNKVIAINLNGNAFLLEEDGYTMLKAYVDTASANIKNSPDKQDIMKDFEQSIADKCNQYLTITKTVVLASEINAIIMELGPVATTPAAASPAAPAASAAPLAKPKPASAPAPTQATAPIASPTTTSPKKFYLVHKGALICGVCTGIADYLNIDVNIVRALFIIFGLITRGGLIIIYFLVFFIFSYKEKKNVFSKVAAPVAPPMSAAKPAAPAAKSTEDTRSSSEALLKSLQAKYAIASSKTQTSVKHLSSIVSASTIWDDFASIISLGGVALLFLIGWLFSVMAVLISGHVLGVSAHPLLTPFFLVISITCAFYIVYWPVKLLIARHHQKKQTAFAAHAKTVLDNNTALAFGSVVWVLAIILFFILI